MTIEIGLDFFFFLDILEFLPVILVILLIIPEIIIIIITYSLFPCSFSIGNLKLSGLY